MSVWVARATAAWATNPAAFPAALRARDETGEALRLVMAYRFLSGPRGCARTYGSTAAISAAVP